MEYFLFSSPVCFAGEHELLETMFEKKAFSLHIRKSGISETELERYLLGLPPEILEWSVLHASPSVAKAFQIKSCALPVTRIPSEGEGLSFWAWCRSFEELSRIPENVARAFLYPVFTPYSELGLKNLTTKNENVSSKIPADKKIYATGGVSEDDFDWARENHFSGVGLCGSVWNHIDPVNAWIKISRKIERENLQAGFKTL